MSAPVARDTEALLERFERYRETKGTLELFDALGTGHAGEVQKALAHALKHPLAGEVGEWLERRGYERPAPPTGQEILEERGIQDVEGFLQRRDAELAELRRSLEVASESARRAQNAASGYAAVCVLLAGVAILGWLAALRVIPFVPEGPTPLMEPEVDEPAGEGSRGEGRR